MKQFTFGLGCAMSSNIVVTQFLAIRDQHGELTQDPVERQILPTLLGIMAFFYGITNRNDNGNFALGFAVGIGLMQILRYVLGCFDSSSEHCKSFNFIP